MSEKKNDLNSLGIIILAAGKGTRMKSALPKVLHSVCGQTLLERALRAAFGLKPKEILTVVGYEHEQVIQEISRVESKLGSEVVFSHAHQAEQRGTGHAAQIGLEGFKGKHDYVLIISGDTPLLDTETLQPFVSSIQDNGLIFMTTICPDPEGFGRIIRDSDGSPTGIKEHKDCSQDELDIDEINVSIYLSKASFLRSAISNLGSDNAQGEYYLTDIVETAKKERVAMEAICSDSYVKVLGANSREELSRLECYRREVIALELMSEGVTLEDLATTYIDEDVQVGSDTYIGACSWLKGDTIIGSNVVIDGNCHIANSNISDSCHIKFSSSLENAVVGKGSAVGPFARLRPGTVLDSDVKIGNFVETKKAHFEKGSKASHLTYVGDATVGEEANLGAGTITCNYDGVNKHHTEIGAGAFIGSNTALVAPVELGAGSLVGAGSVITSDVPPGSLAVARAKQKNIENWSKKTKK